MKNNNHIDERIKEKAKELFVQYGPRNISMDDIAEHSGISKKTLYQLYRSKTDIVQEVVDSLIQSHNQLFQSSRSSANDAIQEVLMQDAGLTLVCKSLRPSFFYELEIYFPNIWTQLEQYKLKIQRGIQDNLRRGKEEGLYREDLKIPFVSDLRMQQLANVLLPELIDEITEFYLHSITTEKGKKLLDKHQKNESGTNGLYTRK